MTAQLIPVGPGLKDDQARRVLKSHEDAIRSLQVPGAPTCVLTTTVSALPAASDYQSHIAIASDIPALAFSDGTNWRRADTGAVIA